MFQKKYGLIIALLVLAIFAVGSVSAADDIATDSVAQTDDTVADDIVIDDDDATVEEDVESQDVNNEQQNLRSPIEVEANSTSAQIQSIINNANSGDTILFKSGQYDNPIYNISLKSNIILDGNFVTLTGNSNDDIFLIYNCTGITIKNFVIDINGGKHGIYGSNVTNSIFDYNEITNGRDGININKFYDNLTITNNIFYDISRDGISLVNNRVLFDADWAEVNESIISSNWIDGAEIGIFIGGNFKGLIDNNIIENGDCGMVFQGKQSLNNGRLSATILNNEISAVDLGINMTSPSVYFLNMTGNTIEVYDDYTEYAILNNTYFHKIINAIISVTGNELYGRISHGFNETCDEFNNTGHYFIDEN